jgi:4-diphosphocytidyl-2-C-methyl-D-erythritol kinase
MAFTLRTPAKINLFLNVVSKRRDGFHNILSLMQMIGLYDTLTFCEESDSVHLDVLSGAVPEDHSNLVIRAARMLQKRMKSMGAVRRGARITLKKEIPISAGLGGGSSDAAATLIGLNRLWGVGLSNSTLAEMGGYVGSDIPFFFYGPTAWVSGRGEQVHPVAPGLHGLRGFVVLVYAGEPVSTADVYHQVDAALDLTESPPPFIHPKMLPTIRAVIANPKNDLEKVTLNAQPVLKQVKALLEALGGEGALMSGSGPTVFARFDTEETANRAAETMKGQGYSAVWTAPLLPRRPRGFGVNTKAAFSATI